MGVLKGYCFNDVFVYTEEQFQDEAMKGKKSVFEMLPLLLAVVDQRVGHARRRSRRTRHSRIEAATVPSPSSPCWCCRHAGDRRTDG